MPDYSRYWVHDLDPVILPLTETLAIRWYGLAYVAGFAIAFGLLALYHKRGRSPLAAPMQESLALALILGVALGGRIGYFLFYEPMALLHDPLALLRVWDGGMASHGGFLGVAFAVVLFARRYRVKVLQVADLVASVTAPGLLLGRIANFVNGELWGRVSDVSWAVIFPKSAPPGMPLELIAPRHPSQLYEAFLEGLVLLVYTQWRFWAIPGRKAGDSLAKPLSARPGHLTGEFLIAYSIARAVGEVFREPDAGLILGLNRGTFYSLFLLVAGIGLVAWTRRRG